MRSTLPRSSDSLTNASGTRYLTAQDLIELHRAVSDQFSGSHGHPGVIESQFGLLSAVQRPQTTIFGKEAYGTFAEKAAAFLFALTQNMPFRSSNRRLALAALLAFCAINDHSIDSKVLDEKGLENLIKRAAGFREHGIAPEQVFRELKEQLGRAIK